MKIVRIIVLIICFTSINITYGQDKDKNTGILKGDYKHKTLSSNISFLAIELSYSKPNFYAENYFSNIDDNFLKYNWGNEISIKYLIRDFISTDLSYTIGFFSSDLLNDQINKNIWFHQTELGMSMYVPYVKNKYVNPYIGIGYQFSFIQSVNSLINTSRPLWDIGATFNIHRPYSQFAVYLIGEYKQAFDLSDVSAYNSFSIGIGAKMGARVHK